MATSSSLDQPASPEDQAPKGFLSLPPEIRLIIYDLVLTTQNDERADTPKGRLPIVLRRPIGVLESGIPPCQPRYLLLRDISLLLVSRLITTETLPLFYALNIFHITLTFHSSLPFYRNEPSGTPFPLHLPWIRHLRLDYLYRCPTVFDVIESLKNPYRYVPDIDTALSNHLSIISFACADLRTFDLCIINQLHTQTFTLYRFLAPPSRTAAVLAELRVRDRVRMSISGDNWEGLQELKVVIGGEWRWEREVYLYLPTVGPLWV